MMYYTLKGAKLLLESLNQHYPHENQTTELVIKNDHLELRVPILVRTWFVHSLTKDQLSKSHLELLDFLRPLIDKAIARG